MLKWHGHILESFYRCRYWRDSTSKVFGRIPVWSWRDSMLFPFWRDSSIGRIPIGKFSLSMFKGFPFWRDSPHIKGRKWRGTLLDWGLRGSTWDWGLSEVERPIWEVWVFNRNLTQPFLNKWPWPIIPWKCKLTFKYGSDPTAFVSLQSKLFSAEIFWKL